MTAVVSSPGLGGAAGNDDCAGFAATASGLYAWVIDGATNVAGADFLQADRGDVAWYATTLSARLQANAASGLKLARLHAAAAADVAALYQDLVVRLGAPSDDATCPSLSVGG